MPLVPTAQTTDRDASSPPTPVGTPGSPKSVARRTRNHDDVTWRARRKANAPHFPYNGSDTELFWADIKELSQAPFPFLADIKNPPPAIKNIFKIRTCYDFLTGLGYSVIAPKDFYKNYDPNFLAMGSFQKNTLRKKRKNIKDPVGRSRRGRRSRPGRRSRRS